jgi:predicted secreted hydrolase
VQSVGGSGAEGFARVTAPRPFVFPQDHGPHMQYATEWWYYTGNLDTDDGRHFGFQLTFFRFGLTPQAATRSSDWATTNIYMAHFALSDVAGQKFYAFERFSRGAAGLAGAEGQPFRVWLENWSAVGAGAQALPMRLQAAQDDIAIDLTLAGGKPVVLQGDQGLSQKSAAVGNASYYYSLTRMPTRGTIRIAAASYAVSGLSWMDREWSTSALGAELVGWDWFALQLSDNREVMFYRLRHADGSSDAFSSGTLIAADGSTSRIARDDIQIEPLGTWQSPGDGARYPAGWRLRIPAAALDLRLTPYLADQELPLTTIYWEGAVKLDGSAAGTPVRGNGYVELTGYAEQSGQQFRGR